MQLPINKFLRYILLIVIITASGFSCALCRMDIPKVSVDVKVSALTDKTHFDVVWKFEKKFVSQLILQYDMNGDGRFDSDEQKDITKSLEDYLDNFNYLTQVTYSKKNSTPPILPELKPFLKKMVFKNDTMVYHYSFDTNFTLQKNHTLTIKFLDQQKNFNFLMRDVLLRNYSGKHIIATTEHYTQIILNDPNSLAAQTIAANGGKSTTGKNSLNIKTNSFLQKLSKQLKIYKEKIQTLLNDIKQNNSVSSYLWLLLFSFIYGLLHALGPGHGKTLVASYFLSENRSVLKAFNISLLIGIVHTFSALLLTVFIFLVLKLLFVSFVTNVEYVATKLSAIVIISIALYLIYKKYRASRINKKVTFSMHNPNVSSCGCSACNTKSEDLGVILAAGIIPCPGTVTIFIFTFGLGIYYVGFLSAIFMSLGMSLVIFITAYLSIHVRKKSSSNSVLKKVFEYGSLVFILCLGLFLLFV